MQDLILFINGNLEKSSSGFLTFSLASAIIGLIIVMIDWSIFTTKKKSYLNLTYDKNKIPALLFAWVIGAGGVGFIGLITNILNFHIMGAVGAGAGWPVLFPRILASVEANVEEQKKKEEE